jgi:hypothetical protein
VSPRRRRPRLVLLLGLAIALLSGSSAAQAIDAAQALTLFKQGRAALAHQDYEGAWAAFNESLRLDVRVGTLLNLADCEEHLGRLAHAYAHWQQAIDRAKVAGDDRVDFLTQRLSVLDPRVPKLTISRGPNTPVAAVIRRDQVDLSDASLGQEIPVDPGHHEVEVSADGFSTKRYAVDLGEGARQSIVVDLGAPPLPTSTSPIVAMPERPPPTRVHAWTTRKTLAVTSGGVGVVGLGVGIASGIAALTKKNDVTRTPGCTSSGACDGPGALAQWTAARDDARTAATISTAAFIVGGATLAMGGILWSSARSAASARVQLGVSIRRVELQGQW